MRKYPFKFLDAYTREDREIFFGRDREIDALYRMVFQTNLLLVYGGSGTGKTSLIRCGLANCFKDSQWLDLYIRRGADINQSLLETIRNHIPEVVAKGTEENSPDWFEEMIADESGGRTTAVPEVLSTHPVARALRELYLANFTPIYLIFDQFEELYTLGTAAEQEELVRTISELVQLPLPIKILIVMREEYLARLYELEKAVPQLRNKKLRIEPMDLPRVEQVILQATVHNPQSNVQLATGREKEIAEAIVEKIREGDVNVKLPYLQVFMDRLYELASGEPIRREQDVTIDLDLVRQTGNIGDVLADFIERQNHRIYQKLSHQYPGLPPDTVWRLLSPFATIDGTKVPIRETDLPHLKKYLPDEGVPWAEKFIRETIAELENGRILRYRKEERTYEVAHDTLARQIAEKRSEEEKAYLKARRMITEGLATFADTRALLGKEQLAYIRPYRKRLQEELSTSQKDFVEQSERRRQREILRLRLGILLAFIVALAVILIVLREQRRTQAALDELLAAQAARERTELNVLLERAGQIAKGGNCPPESMRQTIDSLYQKHEEVTELQQQYGETVAKLTHCQR
ncbi:ATP-binding protein [Flavilitoribacter nigricans]|uniref:Novel STAND NTPase 1 domain-containing protein n=1 Tax=Flavilitoribacter nigricans (strain ATCC 23147 / DSM 23189 / NBRC 102662 / NCIMB 1420 / SS-2) TaxID=1122177 RepID=A0A2D0N4X6_FLAN2|nr:ATP-binding protein [Flavilitoribacter nigricans]PHN03554.1 hypothetical protein CRP01_26510 [Flavilitoribacter nigricans DSM 23189 = NBRC 102662]